MVIRVKFFLQEACAHQRHVNFYLARIVAPCNSSTVDSHKTCSNVELTIEYCRFVDTTREKKDNYYVVKDAKDLTALLYFIMIPCTRLQAQLTLLSDYLITQI